MDGNQDKDKVDKWSLPDLLKALAVLQMREDMNTALNQHQKDKLEEKTK